MGCWAGFAHGEGGSLSPLIDLNAISDAESACSAAREVRVTVLSPVASRTRDAVMVFKDTSFWWDVARPEVNTTDKHLHKLIENTDES